MFKGWKTQYSKDVNVFQDTTQASLNSHQNPWTDTDKFILKVFQKSKNTKHFQKEKQSGNNKPPLSRFVYINIHICVCININIWEREQLRPGGTVEDMDTDQCYRTKEPTNKPADRHPTHL